jgi:hypothetical protein
VTISSEVVTPAKAGVQEFLKSMKTLDSGFCRNDRKNPFRTFYEFIILGLQAKSALEIRCVTVCQAEAL